MRASKKEVFDLQPTLDVFLSRNANIGERRNSIQAGSRLALDLLRANQPTKAALDLGKEIMSKLQTSDEIRQTRATLELPPTPMKKHGE